VSALTWLPRRARVPLAAVLVVVVLLASIGVAFRRDPLAFLFPFGRGPGLDYSGPEAGFVPLEPGYVADVLGEQLEQPAAATAPSPTPAGPVSSSFEPPRRLTDVHPLTNDDRDDARAVPGVPFTARTDTRDATREPGEPADCGVLRGDTVWYRYTPARYVDLVANTFGSTYHTALSVYAEGEGGALDNLGCDSDVDGSAVWQFGAVEGTAYLFQISGPTGGGDLVFNLELLGTTTRATPDGYFGLGGRSLSADGRYLAYISYQADPHGEPCITRVDSLGNAYTSALAPSAAACAQVVVLDRSTGEFVIASVNDAGDTGNALPYHGPVISADGRYVVWASTATNLVDEDGDGLFDDDTNQIGDVFLHDLRTRRTQRVTLTDEGEELRLEPDLCCGAHPEWGGSPFYPTISPSGHFVAYSSTSSMLVDGDTNADYDVFVWDRLTRTTSRASVSSEGREANGWSFAPQLSADGRFISFTSSATTLDWNDSNGSTDDVFLHDRLTGETTIQSVSSSGEQGNGPSGDYEGAFFSEDGRYLTFTSAADNLVEGDTNGIADVFVRDLLTSKTVRVSVSSSGEEAEPSVVPLGNTYFLVLDSVWGYTGTGTVVRVRGISGDGRYVVFDSQANNLAPEDDNDTSDVFVHDQVTATTIRISVNLGGDVGGSDAFWPTMSVDGRIIAFLSHPHSERLGGQSQFLHVYERAEG